MRADAQFNFMSNHIGIGSFIMGKVMKSFKADPTDASHWPDAPVMDAYVKEALFKEEEEEGPAESTKAEL